MELWTVKKSALWDTLKWVKWGLKVATFITLVAILYNFCQTCLLKHVASMLISTLVYNTEVFDVLCLYVNVVFSFWRNSVYLWIYAFVGLASESPQLLPEYRSHLSTGFSQPLLTQCFSSFSPKGVAVCKHASINLSHHIVLLVSLFGCSAPPPCETSSPPPLLHWL